MALLMEKSKYGAINSKIMAMRSKLFKEEDFIELSRSKNISEVASKLQRLSSYANALKELDLNNLHRGDIEEKLFISSIEDYDRIYKFVTDYDLRGYLDYFYIYLEIELLKILLTSMYDERNLNPVIADLIKKFKNHLKIDMEKVAAATDIYEFLGGIEEKSLKKYLIKDYETSHNLFSLQSKMDIYYYETIIKLSEKYLHGKNQKLVKAINGTEIDLTNISWIYRFKTFYSHNEKEIYANLIPYSYKVSKDELIKMVEAQTEGELIQITKNSYYGRFFDKNRSTEAIRSDALRYMYKSLQRGNKDSIINILAYVYDKRLEIENITSLLEGIRYSLDSEEIMKFIILKKKDDGF